MIACLIVYLIIGLIFFFWKWYCYGLNYLKPISFSLPIVVLFWVFILFLAIFSPKEEEK